jgi:hypothetical protein
MLDIKLQVIAAIKTSRWFSLQVNETVELSDFEQVRALYCIQG